ncbi:MAG: DNA-binding protein [Methanosarcina sp.]|nr:DNA-binding protein [Methanosarcina sp.]MDD3316698.1 DNA-binding protein [Methanosarcina sp.]MDD4305642.1 DNA-binding protein [Methanosarcina sp.]MDD4621351.1 DNA-binding protein [Methanosarcina sp.]NLN42754.1 DNA-binding protein [Methanosarcina sp.]
MKVIIDTNGFMIPIQFGVDIFEELKRLGFDEFFVPEAVALEIEKLIKRERGLNKTAAKVARSMMGGCERIPDAMGPADDVILRLSKKMGAAVLTNDIGLKRRLAEEGIQTISLRQKNKLDFV